MLFWGKHWNFYKDNGLHAENILSSSQLNVFTNYLKTIRAWTTWFFKATRTHKTALNNIRKKLNYRRCNKPCGEGINWILDQNCNHLLREMLHFRLCSTQYLKSRFLSYLHSNLGCFPPPQDLWLPLMGSSVVLQTLSPEWERYCWCRGVSLWDN